MPDRVLDNSRKQLVHIGEKDWNTILRAIDQLAELRPHLEQDLAQAVRGGVVYGPKPSESQHAYVVVQEGATGEVYIHGFASAKEAEAYQRDCTINGGYQTSPLIELPADYACLPGMMDILQATIDGAYDLELREPGGVPVDEMEEPYKCDNCGRIAERDSLPDAKKLSMRLEPGGIYTDKECSVEDCGALCFPLERKAPSKKPTKKKTHAKKQKRE